MAENKKSFIMYTSWAAMFKALPDDVAGRLMKHVFTYVKDENPETDELVLNVCFAVMKAELLHTQHNAKEKHWNWQDGITSDNKRVRNSTEYKLWKFAVFSRDNFKCVVCGTTKKIQAHHIKPFCDYPELRLDVDNGVTLCKKHHKKEHYG